MKAEEFLKQYQSQIEGDWLKKHEFTIAKLLELYAEQKAVEFFENHTPIQGVTYAGCSMKSETTIFLKDGKITTASVLYKEFNK